MQCSSSLAKTSINLYSPNALDRGISLSFTHHLGMVILISLCREMSDQKNEVFIFGFYSWTFPATLLETSHRCFINGQVLIINKRPYRLKNTLISVWVEWCCLVTILLISFHQFKKDHPRTASIVCRALCFI